MLKWILLAVAIGSEVTATLSLKASNTADGNMKYLFYALIVAGYGTAFTLLAQVVKMGMPLGIAYGIWAGLGVALVAVLGKFVFGEPLTWVMGAGIALIIGGVLMVELGSKAH